MATTPGRRPAVGAVMTAHIAMFFELADGRITQQRHHAGFEPLG